LVAQYLLRITAINTVPVIKDLFALAEVIIRVVYMLPEKYRQIQSTEVEAIRQWRNLLKRTGMPVDTACSIPGSLPKTPGAHETSSAKTSCATATNVIGMACPVAL
jgi:hypothetical protein